MPKFIRKSISRHLCNQFVNFVFCSRKLNGTVAQIEQNFEAKKNCCCFFFSLCSDVYNSNEVIRKLFFSHIEALKANFNLKLISLPLKEFYASEEKL